MNEIEPNWENTDVEIHGKDVKVIRYGHIKTPEGMAYIGLDPETFLKTFVRGNVPVKQGFSAKDNKSSVMSPLVIDFDRLHKGDYECEFVSYEDLKKP